MILSPLNSLFLEVRFYVSSSVTHLLLLPGIFKSLQKSVVVTADPGKGAKRGGPGSAAINSTQAQREETKPNQNASKERSNKLFLCLSFNNLLSNQPYQSSLGFVTH